MNKVIMMGRLTRDPEIRYGAGANSTTVGSFSIAVDRKFKREGEPEADFFDCTCFNKQAEFAEKYLKKGIKVVIDGHLQNDNYTNKEGQKVYRNRIYIESVEFAESKAVSDQNRSGYQQGGQNSGTSYGGITPDGFMEIPEGLDEQLPFT